MRKLSLNFKIIIVLVVFVLACISVSVIGLSEMKGMNNSIDSLVNGTAVRLGLANRMKSYFLVQIIDEKNMINQENIEGVKNLFERLSQRDLEIKELFKKNMDLASDVGKTQLTAFLELYTKWFEITKQERELVLSGNPNEARRLSSTDAHVVRVKMEKLLDDRVMALVGQMNKVSEKTGAEYNSAKSFVIVISVISISLGLGIAVVILKALNKSITEIINNLTGNSDQVTTAAQEIASSSEALSQAATQQAASLEETASSIEEMNSMVQKNAENARRTSDIANSSSNNAEKGKQVVKQMIVAINDISNSNNHIMEQIDASNQQISDIVKVIAEIGEKTKVINDIVFQTKLLSFNASVEAARAGEHGKGFAVVAEEVGSLAQMSGNAALEISSMLENSIKKVEGIVSETKQKVGTLVTTGRSKVEAGSKIAEECGKVLEDIVESVGSVTEMANEISTACQEQALGIQEITKAMNQLDQVTQTNAATSEEAASAAEELSSQADSLRSVVGTLYITINGEGKSGNKETFSSTEDPIKPKIGHNPSNVVPLEVKNEKKPQTSIPMLKAVGSFDRSIPSDDDARFEDV
jgi:methyl-accepting chemotaxis protein